MDNKEEVKGLTISDLLLFFKRSYLVIIITVLILSFCSLSVFYIINYVNGNNKQIIETCFELTYDDAEKNLMPDKSNINIQDFKNISRLNEILIKHNIKANTSDISSNITITPRFSSKVQGLIDLAGNNIDKLMQLLQDGKLIATQFVVTFEYKNIPNLSKSNALLIMNELLSSYLSKFQTDNFLLKIADKNAFTQDKFINKDYFESIERIRAELLKIDSNIDTLSRQNITSLNNMKLNIAEIDYLLSAFSAYIVTNRVFNINEATTKSNLYFAYQDCKREVDKYTSEIKNLTTFIKEYEAKISIIISDKGEVINGSDIYVFESYNRMINERTTLNTKQVVAEQKLAIIAQTIKDLGFELPSTVLTYSSTDSNYIYSNQYAVASEEQLAYANSMFIEILDKTVDTLEVYNSKSENLAGDIINSFVNIKLSPINSNYNFINSNIMIIVLFTSIILGIFIGSGIYVSLAKRKANKTTILLDSPSGSNIKTINSNEKE